MLHLITIAFSHYNDKARWALEHYHAPFRESGYLPMFHMPAVQRALARGGGATRSERHSSPLSTPVLVREDGFCICDSAEIAHYIADRFAEGPHDHLYPDPECALLEAHWGNRFGPYTRLLAYNAIFNERPHILKDLARHNVGRAQQLLLQALFPLITRVMPRSLGLNPERAARAETRVLEIFDEVDARLADGRPYLVGDRFTAADMTWAAMAAPILVVQPDEGYGAWLPPVDALPPAYAKLARELRERPAGRHAIAMYAQRDAKGAP